MSYADSGVSRGTASEFIQERKYLQNVTPRTIAWYQDSFKAFKNCESEGEFKQRIVELRQRGVSSVSVNSWCRCINAYLKWGGASFKLPKLQEEQKILSTFSPSDVKAIINFKPKGRNLTRAHIVACLLLDTGLRISEALNLSKEDVNLDNLVIKVLGKGGKHRLVPMSLELRKHLWRHLRTNQKPGYLFGTKNGTSLTPRNFQRDFKNLGTQLAITGVRMSPHTCRHSFACEYLRRGGNLEFLRRILGHSSILTTQKYLRSLGVADLQAVHNELSPLSRG